MPDAAGSALLASQWEAAELRNWVWRVQASQSFGWAAAMVLCGAALKRFPALSELEEGAFQKRGSAFSSYPLASLVTLSFHQSGVGEHGSRRGSHRLREQLDLGSVTLASLSRFPLNDSSRPTTPIKPRWNFPSVQITPSCFSRKQL